MQKLIKKCVGFHEKGTVFFSTFGLLHARQSGGHFSEKLIWVKEREKRCERRVRQEFMESTVGASVSIGHLPV